MNTSTVFSICIPVLLVLSILIAHHQTILASSSASSPSINLQQGITSGQLTSLPFLENESSTSVEPATTAVPPPPPPQPTGSTCSSVTFTNGTVLNINGSFLTGVFTGMLQNGGTDSGTTHDWAMSLCTPSRFPNDRCSNYEYIAEDDCNPQNSFVFPNANTLITQYGDDAIELFFTTTNGTKTFQAQVIVYCSYDPAAAANLVSVSNSYSVVENGNDKVTLTWEMRSLAACLSSSGPPPPPTPAPLPNSCDPISFPNSSKITLYPSYFQAEFKNMSQFSSGTLQGNHNWSMSLCSASTFNDLCSSPEYLAEDSCSPTTNNRFSAPSFFANNYGENSIELLYQTKDATSGKDLQALVIVACDWSIPSGMESPTNSYTVDETASKITYHFNFISKGACIGAPDPSVPTTQPPINNCGKIVFQNGSHVEIDPELFKANLSSIQQTGFSASTHSWDLSLCSPVAIDGCPTTSEYYLAEDDCGTSSFTQPAQIVSFYQDNAIQFLFQTQAAGTTFNVRIIVVCSPSSAQMNSPENSYSATANDQGITYLFNLQSSGACVTHGGPSTEAPTLAPTNATTTTAFVNTTTTPAPPVGPPCPSVTLTNGTEMHFDPTLLTADFVDMQQTGLGAGSYTWHFSMCQLSDFSGVCTAPGNFLAENSDCESPFSQDPTTAAMPGENGFVFTYERMQDGTKWIAQINCACSATQTSTVVSPSNSYSANFDSSDLLITWDVEASGCCLHSAGPSPSPTPSGAPTPPATFGPNDCPVVNFPNGSTLSLDATALMANFPQLQQTNLAPALYDWHVSLCESTSFEGLCLSPAYLAQGGSCDQATFSSAPRSVTPTTSGDGIVIIYDRTDASGNPWTGTVTVLCDWNAATLTSPTNSYSAGQEGNMIVLDFEFTSKAACITGGGTPTDAPSGGPTDAPSNGPSAPTPAPPAKTKCPNVLYPNGTLQVISNDFLKAEIADMMQTQLAPGEHPFVFSLCELDDFGGECADAVFIGQSKCKEATFRNDPTTAPNADASGIIFTYDRVDQGTPWQAVINCRCSTDKELVSPYKSYVASMDGQTIKLDFEMQSYGCCFASGSNHQHNSPSGPDSNGNDNDDGAGKLTWGAIFLMSFLIPLFLYIVITMFFNHRNGRRLAPHPDFWGATFSLARDGITFLWSKIRGHEWTSSTTGTEYQPVEQQSGGAGGGGSYSQI